LKRLLASLGLFASLTLAAPSAHAQQAGCQFVLGFKALHDLNPSDVGECIDNQTSQPNGDAQQHTNKGLMAWRKADNWTAFTNGYKTWINGPSGLQNRLNSDRFPWEKDPPAAAPAAPVQPASQPAPSAAVAPPEEWPPYVGPDGKTCPTGYPVRGAYPSHAYYVPGSPGYDSLPSIAACIVDESAAKAIGYHPAN